VALDFDKSFEPNLIEEKTREFWAKGQFYKATRDPSKKPFTIVIPPPNITADLHVGHMLNNTLQDILIRWHRATGFMACWIPGTDHASIATEARVTKMLEGKGIKKLEIGREEFLKHAWQWKADVGGRIIDILKKLGISCDWDRVKFTMDEDYSRSVLKSFVELYKQGLIYRGTRLVNWCPFSQSVISDEEVNNEERQGNFYHVKYKIVGDSEGASMVVATTRPETIFGDLAIAVHPDDERFKHLIGKKVVVPICNREITVIADKAVEIEFGTGCLKVTPSHDPTDYEIGARHNLGQLNVMNKDATLNQNAPKHFQGLTREDARKKVVEELKQLGLLEKTVPTRHVVGISERGGVPIEFYLSEQWYIKMDHFAQLALDATRKGELKLIPAYQEKVWEHWLTNIKDWCISRQLWWGHQIPVHTCQSCAHLNVSVDVPLKCEKCGHDKLTQDPDVLDTWASSWLWPFGIHSWENPSEEQKLDLEYFYPTDVIVTAPEIIFFWIARMVMAGKHFLNKTPFHTVYFTGLLRDQQGRKMSKSLGNFPDTFELIQKYGTDSLRFCLTQQLATGQDIKWADEMCEIGRNFSNKIWNATRYLCLACEAAGVSPRNHTFDNLKWDHSDPVLAWVTGEFKLCLNKSFVAIKDYEFSAYAKALYEFTWMRYCDWFIELIKPRIRDENAKSPEAKESLAVALQVLDGVLRVLHPLMPYITEEIWQRLGEGSRSTQTVGLQLITAPPASEKDAEAVAQMTTIQELIGGVRGVRGNLNIHPGETMFVTLSCEPQKLARFQIVLESLAKVSIQYATLKPARSVSMKAGDVRYFVVLPETVDIAAERNKAQKKLEKAEGNIKSCNAKLSNEQFVASAPAHVLAGAKAQLAQAEDEVTLLKETLETLSGI
jgi:valyl-tRNA synthetase